MRSVFVNFHDEKRISKEIAKVLGPTLLVLLVGCAKQHTELPADKSTAKGESSRTVDVNGVTLSVTMPARCVEQKPIFAAVTLKNGSDDDIFWDSRGTLVQELGLWVWDEHNKQPAMTEDGKILLNEPNRSSVYRSVSMRLAKGDSHTWDVDLSEFYILKPGRYSLSITVNVGIPADKVLADQKPQGASGQPAGSPAAESETQGVAPGPRLTVPTPFEVVKQ